MGKRVQIILSSKAELGKREIYFLFVNTTSFDELEILNTAAKECKCYDDLKEYLLEFTQFSNIANRNEGFTIDDEPFGDYEYIVLVQENDNNEFTITKMYFFDYSVSKTQIEEKFNFFDYDVQNPWKYNFVNYHHNFEKDEEAKFATVILYKESMETSNKYFFETNTICDESAYYRVTEAYRNSRR